MSGTVKTRDFAPSGDGFDLADTAKRVKAILVGSMGNLIEWYDVYAYSAFALYFAGSFFPKSSPEAQQVNAATLFAVAFLARPLGGIIFGYLADRYGRRGSLTAAVLLMCFGSLLIAVTPTYETIGVGAPIILVLARVLQAISQGGEYGASATYLSEISHPNRRGFYSGVWYVTLIGGQLCAILVLLVLQKLFLTTDQLKDWGWRIPFVIGALLAVFTYLMRRDMPETGHFKAADKITRTESRWASMGANWKSMLLVVGITVGGTSAFYTYTTYMQKFLKLTLKFTDDQTTMVTAGSLIFAVILQPIYGALSDKVGRRPMLITFGVLGTLGSVPLLTALQGVTEPFIAFLLICLAWMVVSCYTALTAVVKAEMFPTAVRAMGVGIPYAITVAVFGGTVDAAALQFKEWGVEQGFYWYASACVFVSLVFYVLIPDTKRNSRMDQHI